MSTRQALPGEHLGPNCGHHCGLRSTADEGKMAFIGHCPCDECRCRYAVIDVVIDIPGAVTLVDGTIPGTPPGHGVPMCDLWYAATGGVKPWETGTMGLCTPVCGSAG